MSAWLEALEKNQATPRHSHARAPTLIEQAHRRHVSHRLSCVPPTWPGTYPSTLAAFEIFRFYDNFESLQQRHKLPKQLSFTLILRCDDERVRLSVSRNEDAFFTTYVPLALKTVNVTACATSLCANPQSPHSSSAASTPDEQPPLSVQAYAAWRMEATLASR